MKFLVVGLLAALACLLGACRDVPVEPAATVVTMNAPVSSSTNLQSYLVRGVVKGIKVDEKTIVIQHEEIPKFMPAMTMPFNVKDAAHLDGIQAGDTIWFRLWVTSNESWIDRLTKEKGPQEPQASAPPEREAVRVSRDVQPLTVGDLLPNYALTNELGQRLNLHDFKEKALAFTFIFTRCPLPEFCPRMSHNFQEVCRQLTAMPNGPTNWHLLSISFDPHHDTPEVLRGYGQAFQSDSTRWNLVTGAMIDIDALTDHFDLTIIKQGNEWDHKLRTVVIDAQGRVQKIIYGNEWKPDALVEEIVKAAKVSPRTDREKR